MPKGSDNDTIELLAGLNVFAYGHNVKLVIDGGGIIHETPTGRVTDYRVRSQVQLQL
jgi:hypothetical protein